MSLVLGLLSLVLGLCPLSVCWSRTLTSRTRMTKDKRQRTMDRSVALHLINALFHEVTGKDLYLAAQIKAAIDHSIDVALPPHLKSERFFQAVEKLLEGYHRKRPGTAFSFWNAAARAHGFQPLLARQELVALFRRLSPYPRSTVVIGNLRNAICPDGRRWSPRRREEYADAVRFIEDLARTASPRNSNVVLLFL